MQLNTIQLQYYLLFIIKTIRSGSPYTTSYNELGYCFYLYIASRVIGKQMK